MIHRLVKVAAYNYTYSSPRFSARPLCIMTCEDWERCRDWQTSYAIITVRPGVGNRENGPARRPRMEKTTRMYTAMRHVLQKVTWTCAVSTRQCWRCLWPLDQAADLAVSSKQLITERYRRQH
jgi:hypothetical protein